MRVAISGLFAGPLLYTMMAFAADQPASTVPATPAATPASAEAAVPAVSAESAAAATQATAVQPNAAASDATSAHPAAAPEANGKSTSALSSAEGAAAAAAKDEEAAMDEQMKKQGYKVTMMDGQKRYCKNATVMGSRLNTKNLCWTPDQVKSHQSNVDYFREKQGQKETFGGR